LTYLNLLDAASSVDGYIQPICIEQSSDVNRIEFIADFSSTACTSYQILCAQSGIAEITVTDSGLGWLPGQVPLVTITDLAGSGIGATADAIMVCNDANICSVESILITNAGEFYYIPDQISVDIDLPTDPGGTPATAEVTAVENCGTFTFPDCDGTANPTIYSIWSGEQYAINVCAGGAGPDAFNYTVTSNPTYGGLGPELVVNGAMTTNLTGWTITTNSASPDYSWDPLFVGSAKYVAQDAGGDLSQNILTLGVTYDITFDIYVDIEDPVFCNSQFYVYAGTASTGVQSIPSTSGIHSFSFQLTCTGTPTFSIRIVDNGSCPVDPPFSYRYVKNVSVKEVGAPVPVSCCDCKSYNVIVRNPIDIYYTDCSQTIQQVSVEAGGHGITICGVLGSIFPVNKDDNAEILAIDLLGDCP